MHVFLYMFLYILAVNVLNLFLYFQTIRHWDVGTGLCSRVVRVSKLQPVMALHWEKVCCYYSSTITPTFITQCPFEVIQIRKTPSTPVSRSHYTLCASLKYIILSEHFIVWLFAHPPPPLLSIKCPSINIRHTHVLCQNLCPGLPSSV